MMVTIVFLPDDAVRGRVVFYGLPSCGSTGPQVQLNGSPH